MTLISIGDCLKDTTLHTAVYKFQSESLQPPAYGPDIFLCKKGAGKAGLPKKADKMIHLLNLQIPKLMIYCDGLTIRALTILM